jgi:hypothetical protein
MNGCFDRPPYSDHYLPTGAPDIPQYRIPHRLTRDCQYRFTDLGKADPGCNGCKHREKNESKNGLHPANAA